MITYDDLDIINASSLAEKGSIFSLVPGDYNFKLSIQLPLQPGNYNIEVALISTGVVVDRWSSSTRLSVLDNFESNLQGSVLNLYTDFEIEASADERAFLQKIISNN